MKRSDWDMFMHSILIQEQKIEFSVRYSEKFGNKQHIRLEFWDVNEFKRAYWQILTFLVDNDGLCINTSVKNNAVTIEVEDD